MTTASRRLVAGAKDEAFQNQTSWTDQGGASGPYAIAPPSWVERHQKAILVTLVALVSILCIVAGQLVHQQPNANSSHAWVLRGVGIALAGLEVVVLIGLYVRDKRRADYIDLPTNHYRVASLELSPGCQGVREVLRTLADLKTTIFCIQGRNHLGTTPTADLLPPYYLWIEYQSSLIAWDRRLFSLEESYVGPNERVDTDQDATKVFLSDPVANRAFSVVNLRLSHRVTSEAEYAILCSDEVNRNRMDNPSFYMINQPAGYQEKPSERTVIPRYLRSLSGSYRLPNPATSYLQDVRYEGATTTLVDFNCVSSLSPPGLGESPRESI